MSGIELSKKLFYEFQEFVYTNNVLVAAAGWSIGTVTKETISKILDALVMPFLYMIIHSDIVQNYIMVYIAETPFQYLLQSWGEIIWSVITWVLTLFMTFIMLEYILNRGVLKLKTRVKDDAKKDFVKAKAEASKDRILPTKKEVAKLELKDAIEKEQGRQLLEKEEKEMSGMMMDPTTIYSAAYEDASVGVTAERSDDPIYFSALVQNGEAEKEYTDTFVGSK